MVDRGSTERTLHQAAHGGSHPREGDPGHALRKRVKDLWYDVRLLEGPWLRAPRLGKQLNELETLLGDVHNLTMLRERELDAVIVEIDFEGTKELRMPFPETRELLIRHGWTPPAQQISEDVPPVDLDESLAESLDELAREVAGILECSVGAARVRAHRALRTLRDHYFQMQKENLS